MPTPLIVILGGDTLAFKVAELLVRTGSNVVLVSDPSGDTAGSAARLGARFAPRFADERRTFAEAGIADATVAMALTDDDHENLQFVLAARDLNPKIRIVLRQFNRTLGRKIEQNLADCSVVSLSSLSAATYAGAAVDPECVYGMHFPGADGPLVGFMQRVAGAAGIAGATADEAEASFGSRVIGRNGEVNFDRTQPFAADDIVMMFATVTPREIGAGRRGNVFAAYARGIGRRSRTVTQLDPVSRGALLAAFVIVSCGALYFALTLRLPPLTALYFVLSTMTTTGYGDIAPGLGDLRGQAVSMALMLAGITFSGIFIAVLSSRFAHAQYVATQGLRQVAARDHIIVCGAGNVGARVIEQLRAMRRAVVVVEAAPRPEAISASRAGHFQLLTGDASRDETLDLCNVGEAAAVIALTNSDTMNLEIALGARARNKNAHVVMRVQQESFEESVRRHFGFERVFGTAALAAPVFAGLAYGPGMRGLVAIGDAGFAVLEGDREPTFDAQPAREVTVIPLAVWRDGHAVLIDDFADVRPGEIRLALGHAQLGTPA